VIAKETLRTRKEYGVSAEELKELIHFLKEGLQMDRSSLSLQRNCRKHQKTVYKKEIHLS
jgi:hypothetical protein